MNIRRIGFIAAAGLFVALNLLVGSNFMPSLFTGWFQGADPHVIHNISDAAIYWAILIGMVAHLYKPRRNLAGMQQVLTLLTLGVVIVAIAGQFWLALPILLVVAGIMTVLHPARRDLFHFERTAMSPLLAGLAVAAAIPLAIFAVHQFGLELGPEPIHAGHWADMAIFTVGLAALGLLASLRTPGWRIPTWTVGGSAAIYGVASVLFSMQPSSAGMFWGTLAILWGLGFVMTAEAIDAGVLPTTLRRTEKTVHE